MTAYSQGRESPPASSGPLRTRTHLGFLAIPLLLAACAADTSGYPPVARIDATPRAIPEADSFRTAVTLDATMSADPIDDPDGTRPLRYRWEIIGDEFRIQDGSLTSAQVTLTFLGERPATVQLTVTDGDGLESSAQEHLQLTITP
jgi:hypothetical protein